MRNSSCWRSEKQGQGLNGHVSPVDWSPFFFRVDLTLPFSNLLTLFLLVIMSRSPVSPRSPMTLRKTLASVPPPPTLPVQMVTRYFITGRDKW